MPSQSLTVQQRRGVVVVLTAVMIFMFLGFATLSIDVGQACATKAKLQSIADSAALAGVGALISDDILLGSYDFASDIQNNIDTYTQQNGQLTSVQANNSQSAVIVCSNGITVGHLTDPSDASEAIDTTHPDTNAVEVVISMDGACNPKLETIFASMIGFDEMDLEVSATAFYDDRFAGYAPGDSGGALTPFSLHEDDYVDQLANPQDNWKWDPATNSPVPGSDGIPELWIFPDKQSSGGNNGNGNNGNGNSGGGSTGAGNFGTLNIGLGNQGTTGLGNQILNGVTAQEMLNEIGTDTIIFSDDSGIYTYSISGNPGVSAGMESYVDQRVGDVIGFFLHTSVASSGSNATFTIEDIKFGRIMEIDLTGGPDNKRIVVQPTVYSGAGLIFDEAAPSSGGLIAKLQLIR